MLGCLGGAAIAGNSSGCAPGAVGAVVGELTAEFAKNHKMSSADALALAKVMSAVSGVVVGGGGDNAAAVNIAASTGANAAENNFLKHDQAKAMQEEFAACKAKGPSCDAGAIAQKYKKLSDDNISAVQNCVLAGDVTCVSNAKKDAATVAEVSVPGAGGLAAIFEERAVLAKLGNLTTVKNGLIDDVTAARQMAVVRSNACVGLSASSCDTKILDLKGQAQKLALTMVGGTLLGAPAAMLLIDSAPALAAAAKLSVAACSANLPLCAVQAGNAVGDIVGAEALGGAALSPVLVATLGSKTLAAFEQIVSDVKAAEKAAASTIKSEVTAASKAENVAAVCTGSACFVAGTVIETTQGPKAIETFVGGEMVLSRHEHTRALGYRPVISTKTTYAQTLYEVVVVNSEGQQDTLHTTSEHPFWVQGTGWIRAADLAEHMVLTDKDGQSVRILGQKALAQTATVYNIEVDEHHTYHVGALGVWVHNANCCDVLAQNPITPSLSGNLSKGKLTNEAIVLDTPNVMGPVIADIRVNGDYTGRNTEKVVNAVLQTDSKITVLTGTKYGGDKGLDHVVQFVDPQTNKLMTMIIDSKQLAKNGATSLDSKAAGGVMQLSDTSLNVVMQNIGKSPATEAIRNAQFEGTLVKAVAYVDKSSGNLMIVPVNVPNPTK